MNVYVSFDGDTIGQMVGRARLADDVEAVRRVNQSIDNGNRIWRSWCESHGGNVIEIAGDEGALEVPAAYLDELPKIRQQYAEAVGASVSVGIGTKLSESSKALLAAKLRGKDRIEFYTDEVNELIQQAEAHKGSEQEKIVSEYLSPLDKAAPAMNPDAFSGPSRPSAATVDKPTPTQGDHEEAQVAGGEQEQSGQSPELTSAGDDFEKDFHDAAASQEQEDTEGHAQATKNIDDVKKQIVVALQMLKQQAPVLEQIKQTAPDAYKAMMGLAQAVIGLSREIQNVSPMKKAEIDEPVQLILSNFKVTLEKLDKNTRRNPQDSMVDAVRGALSDDLRKPEYRGAKNCMAGHCYVASEALYHLLGGKEAGWTPHHISHEGGPHWFLKNRHSGKVLDATADQFETPVPYRLGRGKGFLTAMPSKRASTVISRVLTRKSESAGPLAKMAIADIPAGQMQRNGTYDYSHVLPEAHRKAGYQLMVTPRTPGDTNFLHTQLMHNGKQAGYLSGRYDSEGEGPLQIDNSLIDQEHRGKGLGVPMYEALYAHAKHSLGLTHVGGHEHSTSAGRVHQALAQKHGLQYKPAIDKNKISAPGEEKDEQPFDGRYFGYQYALKGEKDPNDKYEAIEDGDLEKSGLPMPGASAHHHTILPVGSQLNQKIKVQHSDGKKGWVSVQAGQVRSQDPSGHPISSRNPAGK